MIGVFSPEFNTRIANALKRLNSPSSLVISSLDGMDEISVSSVTKASFLKDGKIKEFEINPEDFGIKLSKKEDVVGGDANENAKVALDIFAKKEMGPKRDIVLLNAAYSLLVDGKVSDAKDGFEMAKMAVDSGLAKQKLDEIIKFSQQF